ncbi:MAG: hypothetical protein M1829_006270 [Trizodia sp. TS-e1964]|nr:MAG: hypothetical protein M1829_006270 [Trizodia sp. TS-e1964]
MSSNSAQALVKGSSDTELMPPPPFKRIKRPSKVLDEDTYTDALSEIIARDFFPGLLETRTQQEYLDALDSRNSAWIESAARKLTEVMTPGPRRGRRGVSMQTPRPGSETPKGYAGDDTPMSVVSAVSVATTQTSSKPEVDIDMSLDNFQAKYTSEDNESFNKLLDKQNLAKTEKYSWMWTGNKIPSARQIAHRERERKMLQAKGAEKVDEKTRRLLIQAEDQRKAMPDSWKSRPDNQLMFEPTGIEYNLESAQQKAEAESKAAPKAVIYKNTRMPLPPPEPAPAIPPSPSISAIRDAIAGISRPTDSDPGFTGGETPRVNGYSFVDEDEPPPEPSLLGTSLLLSSGDSAPSPFQIHEQSKRESLHHRMVDRVTKNNRTASRQGATGKVSTTPVPKFPSSPRLGRKADLTPAAQRLWSKVGTPGGSRGLEGVFGGRMTPGGSGLKNSWTPTPKASERGKK